MMQRKMDLYNATHDTKMTNENTHINHVKPIQAFDLDDEDKLIKCTH